MPITIKPKPFKLLPKVSTEDSPKSDLSVTLKPVSHLKVTIDSKVATEAVKKALDSVEKQLKEKSLKQALHAHAAHFSEQYQPKHPPHKINLATGEVVVSEDGKSFTLADHPVQNVSDVWVTPPPPTPLFSLSAPLTAVNFVDPVTDLVTNESVINGLKKFISQLEASDVGVNSLEVISSADTDSVGAKYTLMITYQHVPF